MLNPAWIEKSAEAFWELAGDASTEFPRDLEAAILFALPIAVVDIPRLRSQVVNDWLLGHGSSALLNHSDHRLHACLIAWNGCGIVFVDGIASIDERRFSLAHELAHFMADYLIPRNRAIETLGVAIVDVLDGRRSPTLHETANAVVADVTIGMHINLLGYDSPSVMDQELEADQLAVELLAPAPSAIEVARAICVPEYGSRVAVLGSELKARFGLPRPVANGYAVRLLRYLKRDESITEWIGLSNSP